MVSLIRIFLIAWVLSLAFLLTSLINEKFHNLLLFLFLGLFGINILLIKSCKENISRFNERIEKIKKEPKKTEEVKELNLKISSLENELENFKIENEKKYRDVVRKVLELENKLNKKYKLLGEAIVQLSKRKKR